MKKIGIVVALLVSVFAVQAQKGQGWEGLSNMKSVMKQTFLPLVKENNLQPTKDNAAKLYEMAVLLENGTKPRAFKKKAMSEKFASITSLSKSLKELVENNATDENIKNELVNLHAVFAEIAHHKKSGGAKH
jgi:hypothetical protein